MRVTNNIIQSNATLAMQLNLQRMAQAQTQASSGQKYASFAEDPHAQSQVMQTSGSLRALEQYKRNVDDATARANMEDSILQQLTDTLDRARDVASQQGSATASASTRASAKAEVDNLIDFVVGLGNTKYQNEYLFGGNDVTNPPVTNTAPFYTAAAPSGAHTTEISAGQQFKSNHNAKELLLDTGTLQALKNLSTALGSNDTAGIGAAIGALGNANLGVQALVGDIGARQNQLEVTSANLDALKANLTTFKSNLSEVDQETAITNLVARQTAYQSAMLATSRVIGMTLTDYLR
jgi:flagellar hook-associated protein 3 FlgL